MDFGDAEGRDGSEPAFAGRDPGGEQGNEDEQAGAAPKGNGSDPPGFPLAISRRR